MNYSSVHLDRHYSTMHLDCIFMMNFIVNRRQNFLTFRALRDFTARDGAALLVVALTILRWNVFVIETVQFEFHSCGFRWIAPFFCNARITVTHKGHRFIRKPRFWPLSRLILEDWCFSSFGFLGGFGDYRSCHQLILPVYQHSILWVIPWLLIGDFWGLFWLYLFNLALDCAGFRFFWSHDSPRLLANQKKLLAAV